MNILAESMRNRIYFQWLIEARILMDLSFLCKFGKLIYINSLLASPNLKKNEISILFNLR